MKHVRVTKPITRTVSNWLMTGNDRGSWRLTVEIAENAILTVDSSGTVGNQIAVHLEGPGGGKYMTVYLSPDEWEESHEMPFGFWKKGDLYGFSRKPTK